MELLNLSLKNIKTIAVLSLVLLFGYSCEGDENYYGPDWDIRNYTVQPNEWRWNSDYERFECVKSCPSLSEFVYEEGSVTGQIFWGTQGVNEVQRSLSYTQSYWDDGKKDFFTRTIGFEYYIGNVRFYCQDSDLESAGPNVPYDFKITLFW